MSVPAPWGPPGPVAWGRSARDILCGRFTRGIACDGVVRRTIRGAVRGAAWGFARRTARGTAREVAREFQSAARGTTARDAVRGVPADLARTRHIGAALLLRERERRDVDLGRDPRLATIGGGEAAGCARDERQAVAEGREGRVERDGGVVPGWSESVVVVWDGGGRRTECGHGAAGGVGIALGVGGQAECVAGGWWMG